MPTINIKDPGPFWGHADIPMHGDAPPIRADLQFAHMGRKALAEFIKVEGRSDVQTLMAIVRDWKPEQFDGETFSEAAVDALCDKFAGAAMAIYEAWLTALAQARRGN